MADSSYRIELAEGGYEKIEAKIQNIENLANNGIFAKESVNARFFQIVSEAKRLRQTLRETLIIIPAGSGGEGGAA